MANYSATTTTYHYYQLQHQLQKPRAHLRVELQFRINNLCLLLIDGQNNLSQNNFNPNKFNQLNRQQILYRQVQLKFPRLAHLRVKRVNRVRMPRREPTDHSRMQIFVHALKPMRVIPRMSTNFISRMCGYSVTMCDQQ